MKFVKGMILGGIISAGVVMVCTDALDGPKKKMIKKGKQWARKMGII